MVMAVDLPLRRRLAAYAGSIAACLVTGLGWIVAASLTPLGSRPWPIGSTDGSIWNVVLVYNGLDRVRGAATARALALDPPGPLRLFGTSGPHYLTQIGTLLLAALILGAVALAATLARQRTGFGRLQLAGVAFLGTWLVVGVGLLSHMSRMQPRYLEAVTPAIAAVIGVAIAQLAARTPRNGLPLRSPSSPCSPCLPRRRSPSPVSTGPTPACLSRRRFRPSAPSCCRIRRGRATKWRAPPSRAPRR